MKKIINNADNFVEESISGLVKSYPEIYKYSSETNKVLMRSVKGNNKVGLVLPFEYDRRGEDWYHKGLNSKGGALHEIWHFRK